MATPNYGYEKRQRELAKKRKKEEKAARKALGPAANADQADADEEGAPVEDGDRPGADDATKATGGQDSAALPRGA